MSSDFVTTESVESVAEELGNIVSPDYNGRDVTTPGKYRNDERVIAQLAGNPRVVTLRPEVAAHGRLTNPVVKVYWFQMELKGLTDPKTGRRVFRPDRYWFSTEPKRKTVFGSRGKEFYPGLISDATEYLTSAGYPMSALRNLSGIEALESILADSTSRPTIVRVGLGPRGKDTGTLKANGKKFYRTPGNPAIGVYEGKRLYTKDFSDGQGGYRRSIEFDGETWEAQELVEGFAKITA